MADRIISMRHQLYDTLKARGEISLPRPGAFLFSLLVHMECIPWVSHSSLDTMEHSTFNIQEDILFLLKPELGIISMTGVNSVWICSLAVAVCINVVSCVLQIMLQ